jgi:colanic acid biosynthesis glycosyl transferase WcaI
MRIGVVGVNFFPERVGIGVYTHDMCRFFVEAGHSVSVITGFPYYPAEPRHRGRWYLTEQIDGITVHRCFTHVPKRWHARGRVAQEISFAASITPRLLTLRPQVLVVISPLFIASVTSAMVARARGIPLAVHIQDLQPDAAAGMGMLQSRIILRALYGAERRLYRTAALVTSLDDSMCARIVQKGVPAQKVAVFPNWVDMNVAEPAGGSEQFRREHGFGDQFLVVYSGSMGVKHGLELIVRVAATAAHDPAVRFVLIGDGVARQDLEAAARERQLANVTFLPLQPLDRFSAVIAASDISILPQRPEVRDLVVPSKILRILAGGSPIVAAADPASGLGRILSESGAGLVVSREDPRAVWEAIQALRANPERRADMGRRGRAYARKHFDRTVVLGRYLGRLENVLQDGGRRTSSATSSPGSSNWMK